MQEGCNGPIPAPNPQEPATNHTGSGKTAFPPVCPSHVSLSSLTRVSLSCSQTNASCRLSGGLFRASSPRRPRQARLKLRFLEISGHTHHFDVNSSKQQGISDLLSSWQRKKRRGYQSSLAAWASLTNVRRAQHEACKTGLTSSHQLKPWNHQGYLIMCSNCSLASPSSVPPFSFRKTCLLHLLTPCPPRRCCITLIHQPHS